MEYTAILNCFKAVSHLYKAYKLIWPAHLFTCSCILIKEKDIIIHVRFYVSMQLAVCIQSFYTLKINVTT